MDIGLFAFLLTRVVLFEQFVVSSSDGYRAVRIFNLFKSALFFRYSHVRYDQSIVDSLQVSAFLDPQCTIHN